MKIVVISPDGRGSARADRAGGRSSRRAWSATTCASRRWTRPSSRRWLARPARGMAAAARSSTGTTALAGRAGPRRAPRQGRGGPDPAPPAPPAAPATTSPRCAGILRITGSVLFGPVFPSLSKPGYGPAAGFSVGRARRASSQGAKPPGGPRPRDRRNHGRAARRAAASWGSTARRSSGRSGARPIPWRRLPGIRDAAAKLEGARHAA